MSWEGQPGGAGAMRGCLFPYWEGSVFCDKADELGLLLKVWLHYRLAMLVEGSNDLCAVAEDEAAGRVCLG